MMSERREPEADGERPRESAPSAPAAWSRGEAGARTPPSAARPDGAPRTLVVTVARQPPACWTNEGSIALFGSGLVSISPDAFQNSADFLKMS